MRKITLLLVLAAIALSAAGKVIADYCACNYYNQPYRPPRGSSWKIVFDASIDSLMKTSLRDSINAWRTEQNWNPDLPKFSETSTSTNILRIRYTNRSAADVPIECKGSTTAGCTWKTDDTHYQIAYFNETQPWLWLAAQQMRNGSHELGHFEGLGHSYTAPQKSCKATDTVMGAGSFTAPFLYYPSPCDSQAAEQMNQGIYRPATLSSSGSTNNPSPIIISLDDRPIQLTDAANGVDFDIRNDGRRLRIAWTIGSSQDAFLCFDADGNGWIDSGRELFGNYSPQPDAEDKNGFLALAEFDKIDNGGNGDGWIDSKDEVFLSLRLWLDQNHDGLSQPGELVTLSEANIIKLSLDYHESERRDRYGNLFRYRADAVQNNGTKLQAVDVFLSFLEEL